MAKRKRRRNNRAPNWIKRLPFPPPFTKEEWGKSRLSELFNNPAYLDYFERCMRDIVESGRAHVYVNMLAMTAHIGRLPEFDERSYGKFLKEAQGQHFTESQMVQALELILETSAPGEILPNAAAAFEFLAFVGDFVNHYGKHIGAGTRLFALTEKISGMALMAFAVAINAELGIRKDFWRSKGD
jgi:hypothetical protein